MELTTQRLLLREMNEADFDALNAVLGDAENMRYYPCAFDAERVRGWIARNMERYRTFGFGLWAGCLRETGEMIGDCGLTMQTIHGVIRPEIGYHIRRDLHGRGYAREAACAVRDWAFTRLPFRAIYSYMKASNEPSARAARSWGCRPVDEYPDEINGTTRVFAITRAEWEALNAGESPLRLRPYKPCDAAAIVSWIGDETAYYKWSAGRFGAYPLTAEGLNRHYAAADSDSFFEMTACDASGPVGHLIMRYPGQDRAVLRFGFVIVDPARRGRGDGRRMLQLAVRYAFDQLSVDKITLGVFLNNPPAYRCYRSVGFREVPGAAVERGRILGETWEVQEMELTREAGFAACPLPRR